MHFSIIFTYQLTVPKYFLCDFKYNINIIINIRNEIIFHKNQLKRDCESVQMNRSSCSLSFSYSLSLLLPLSPSFPLSISLSLTQPLFLSLSTSLCVPVLLRLLIEFNLPSLILHSPLCLSCL